MKKLLLTTWIISLFYTPYVIAQDVGMVTGSKTGTYIQFGRQIADEARKEGLYIEVKESKGSIANIERLIKRENAAFAI